MENKILIKLIVPEINETFDVFIPVNEVTWKVKKMLVKCLNDVNNLNLDTNKNYTLIKKENSRIYKNNEIIIDTDIRNSTELILLSE